MLTQSIIFRKDKQELAGGSVVQFTKVTSVFSHRIPFPALFVSTAEKVTFRVSLDPAIHHKPATLYGMGLSQRSPCILLSASLHPAFLRVWGL